MIELILAGFLGLGLPPAATPVAATCDYTSSRVGCTVDKGGGGGRDSKRDSKGDKGGGKGKK